MAFHAKYSNAMARLPEPFRALAAVRRYLPRNVPVVKRVGAEAGDEVCALGDQVFVDGRPVVMRKKFDALGRGMPSWHGCRMLQRQQLFLLIARAPISSERRSCYGAAEMDDRGPRICRTDADICPVDCCVIGRVASIDGRDMAALHPRGVATLRRAGRLDQARDAGREPGPHGPGRASDSLVGRGHRTDAGHAQNLVGHKGEARPWHQS